MTPAVRDPNDVVFADDNRAWTPEQIRAFSNWLVENRDTVLEPGTIRIWIAQCKKDVFNDDANIDPTKIRNKYHNLRKAYVKARSQFQNKPGFGITEEESYGTVKGKSILFHEDME